MNTSSGAPRKTMARNPSHFGSYRYSPPGGISSAIFASIGSTGGSIGKIFGKQLTLRARIELIPAGVGIEQRLLELLQSCQRLVDRVRGFLVEAWRRHGFVQLLLLGLHGLYPRRQF